MLLASHGSVKKNKTKFRNTTIIMPSSQVGQNRKTHETAVNQINLTRTLDSKLAKSAKPDPPKGSLGALAELNGSFIGAKGSGDFVAPIGGAGRWGPFTPLATAFGGAGRGGGCLDFLGGKAGVGLSTRPAGRGELGALNGSLPKGSAPTFGCNEQKFISKEM